MSHEKKKRNEEIRVLYKKNKGALSHRKIGRAYKISESAVCRIINRKK